MTTAIHIIMKEHIPYRYDSYDPVHSYKVDENVLKIVGAGDYEVNLDEVAHWEYVEGPNVNSREYFEEWAERHAHIAPRRPTQQES